MNKGGNRRSKRATKLTIKKAAAKRHREESINAKEQSNDFGNANDKYTS